MIKLQDIQPIVNDYISGSDMFLVSLKVSADNIIEVVIDAPHGVNLDQCATLSSHINAAFDRDVEDFELTVSSAGLDQPLQVLEQYRKYINCEVEIVLKTGKKIKTILLEATEKQLAVQHIQLQKVEGKKRKQPVTIMETYSLTDIKTTKPIIKWKD